MTNSETKPPPLSFRILYFSLGIPAAIVLLYPLALGALLFYEMLLFGSFFVLAFIPYAFIGCGAICYYTIYNKLRYASILRTTQIVHGLALLLGAVFSLGTAYVVLKVEAVEGYFQLVVAALIVLALLSLHAAFLLFRLQAISIEKIDDSREPISPSELLTTRRLLAYCYAVLAALSIIAYTDWMSGIAMGIVAIYVFICVPLMVRRCWFMHKGAKSPKLESYLCGLYFIAVFLFIMVVLN